MEQNLEVLKNYFSLMSSSEGKFWSIFGWNLAKKTALWRDLRIVKIRHFPEHFTMMQIAMLYIAGVNRRLLWPFYWKLGVKSGKKWQKWQEWLDNLNLTCCQTLYLCVVFLIYLCKNLTKLSHSLTLVALN